MSKYHGIFTPICTPFSPSDQSIQEDALRRLIDFQLAGGVHGIIPCGGTGEFATLSFEERKRVTEITVDQVNKRIPVMAHTGACSTWEVIELSRHAESAGCDALMIVPPFYEIPSDDELIAHYSAISDAVPLPIMVYNIPAHSKINLRPELLHRLAQIPNVQMLKDSTGDLVQFQQILEELSDSLIIFNGSDTGSFAGLSHGAKGCVWGVANAAPRQCVELYELVVEKRDLLKAREIWKPLYRLNHFFETEGYAATAKAATTMAGVDMGVPRAPFKPLTEEQRSRLEVLMQGVGALAEQAAPVVG
ncbi:MAG: 4-hydroxy-tetrahydrodipicolinate synthase [Chloroflexi bacterium]|nr:4-hydroxy-tetrahydrodipicolinate synthase [Chloroflexota bacterium]